MTDGAAALRELGAIVLAAGFSRRLPGENKLLRELGGRPLLAHTMDTVSSLGLAQVIAVASGASDAISSMLPHSAELIVNPEAANGMGSSIARGAQALAPSLRGVFITLGDMPFVEARDYRKLADAFTDAPETAICVPLHQGRRGHPVLFGRAHFNDLTSLTGDQGARSLLTSPETALIEIDDCSAGCLMDLDDREAFEEAERTLAAKRLI
ncbi:MAG: NTP transferase domain-containing protein [Rhodomicrobiaceae bacterium]